MKLSIIIPCYNAADTLGAQLEALAGQDWSGEWEVIVANNGSTDDTVAVAQRYQDRLPLRLVDASAQRGATFAYLTATAAASGDALIFCDADDVVGEGYLRAMAAALAEHAAVAARCDMERLNQGWVRAAHSNTQVSGLQPYHYPPFLPHAGGSTMGIRRQVFIELGGFDPDLYLIDTDLCWRLQLAGHGLHFVPQAVVYVRHRTTLKGIFRQGRTWGEGNVALYKKYRPLGMPELSKRAGLEGWGRLLRRLPFIRSQADLARWLWQAGWRWGRLRASLRQRLWAL